MTTMTLDRVRPSAASRPVASARRGPARAAGAAHPTRPPRVSWSRCAAGGLRRRVFVRRPAPWPPSDRGNPEPTTDRPGRRRATRSGTSPPTSPTTATCATMMDEIKQLNALDSGVLQAGQRLVVRRRWLSQHTDSVSRLDPGWRAGKTGAGPGGSAPAAFAHTAHVPVAGYSGTPLVRKLGIKDDHVVLLDGAPADLELGDTGGAHLVRRLPGTADVTLTFHTSYDALPRLPPCSNARRPPAWSGSAGPSRPPRRRSDIDSDLDENLVRDLGLELGLRRREGRRGRRHLVRR